MKLLKVDSQNSKPVVVVGDGWAALGTVASLVHSGKQIRWVTGTISRILSPLPSFETAFGPAGSAIWKQIAAQLEIDLGERHTGSFLREFKNKAFREPSWTKSSENDDRVENREESLWGPEQNVAQISEVRFDLSSAEIEQAIREKLTEENFSNLRRIEGSSIKSIKIEDGKVQSLILSSGEEVECGSVVYADRWSSLAKIQGVPKALSFTRNREHHGLLQATFTHTVPVGVGVLEGFLGVMNRESGEEFERHVWGYFASHGGESYWTVCLSADEVEDNHEISKKLRRMKSTLDKMFTGSAWLPNPEQGFMANVASEQVRFEEALIYSDKKIPTAPIQITGADEIENMWFLTDGYGSTSSLAQVQQLMDLPIEKEDLGSEASESSSAGDSSSGISHSAHISNP